MFFSLHIKVFKKVFPFELKIMTLDFCSFTSSFQEEQKLFKISSEFCKPCWELDRSIMSSAKNRELIDISPIKIGSVCPWLRVEIKALHVLYMFWSLDFYFFSFFFSFHLSNCLNCDLTGGGGWVKYIFGLLALIVQIKEVAMTVIFLTWYSQTWWEV